jgi:4-amino-4-deoxy-L-arabinose transferase-like glycosyltransferase
MAYFSLDSWGILTPLFFGRNEMKPRSKAKKSSVPVAPAVVPSSPWRENILLAICVLLLSGIYIGKAYNMDDPLVVWTAQRIATTPADFYGFNVNWYGYNTPMVQTDLNPPGISYYLSIFGILSHWRESAMHSAVVLFGIALILGIYWLARKMGGEPLVAASIALVCPGVFVSMGTVMTDLPMVALWVWAIVLWLHGLEKEHSWPNAVSGLLIGLAVMAKYFALSLVPLLLVYTLLFGRKRWARLVWLITPLAILLLFELYTQWLYGAGQIREYLGLVNTYYESYPVNYGRKFLAGVTFLGAGAAPVLFLAPWLWRRTERRALWIGALVVALFTVSLQQSGWQAGETQGSFAWWFWLQIGLWLLAGIHLIALAVSEIWSRRDRDAILLGLWLCGTLFYCMFLYHLVNIRVILPVLPVAALLCVRRMQRLRAESKAGAPAMIKLVWPALAVGLALSLCVAWADITLANSAKIAAERIAPEKRSGRTWFSGHWGFQYYMQARGAKPIDSKHQDFRLGDTVVTPMNASNRLLPRPRVASRDESFELPVCSWVTTMQADCGAGFYADIWGPLPFVFGPVPSERYQVTVLGRR